MNITGAIPDLPQCKTPLVIYADYLRYLHECTLTYITQTHGNSSRILREIGEHVVFIISHPNGWEGAQQSRLREAAVLAGLVEEAGDPRIHFVTEGEAGLHFCLQHDRAAGTLGVRG
jgi:hypothetical protein